MHVRLSCIPLELTANYFKWKQNTVALIFLACLGQEPVNDYLSKNEAVIQSLQTKESNISINAIKAVINCLCPKIFRNTVVKILMYWKWRKISLFTKITRKLLILNNIIYHGLNMNENGALMNSYDLSLNFLFSTLNLFMIVKWPGIWNGVSEYSNIESDETTLGLSNISH